MANAVRGEYRLVVGKGEKKREFTLKWGTHAICVWENRFGVKIQELSNPSKFGMVEMRGMLWSALQKYHAADFAGLDPVDELIDDIGIKKVGDTLDELWKVTNPDLVDGDKENPPAAQPGTGDGSTLPPAPSA